jgi:hypothetical protein
MYFDPFARGQAALQRMLDGFIDACRVLFARP